MHIHPRANSASCFPPWTAFLCDGLADLLPTLMPLSRDATHYPGDPWERNTVVRKWRINSKLKLGFITEGLAHPFSSLSFFSRDFFSS